MNWSRGFLRLWLIASMLWSVAVVALSASSAPTFKRYEIEGPDGRRHVVSAPSYMTDAEIIGGFRLGTLPRPEPFPVRQVAAIAIAPPAAIFVLGLLLGWIGRGFKTEAAR